MLQRLGAVIGGVVGAAATVVIQVAAAVANLLMLIGVVPRPAAAESGSDYFVLTGLSVA